MAIGTPVAVAAVSGTPTATTGSFTPADDSRIFAWFGCRSGTAYTTATISDSSGLTWTQVGTDADGPATNPFIRMRLFWANAGNSAPAMTVSATNAAGNLQFLFVCHVPMAADPVTSNTGTGANAAGDPSATISGTPGAALTFAMGQVANSFTAPAGYTSLQNATLGANKLGAAYDLSSPSTTATWTSTNLNSVTLLTELAEVSSGGITGTAAGDADTTGSATGSVAITGTASGVADTTGTAAGTVPAAGPVIGTASGSADTTGSAAGTAAPDPAPQFGGSIPRWYEEMRTARPRRRYLGVQDAPEGLSEETPPAPKPIAITRKRDAVADMAQALVRMQRAIARQDAAAAQEASAKVQAQRIKALERNRANIAATEARMAELSAQIEALEAEHEAEISLENDLIFVATILMNA